MPAFPMLVAAALAGASLGGVPMAAPVVCDVTDATLTWGFKESFRSYIDGDIANGSWSSAGNASYATPNFTWSGGTGTYTPIYDRLEVAFTGSVEFTGHDGLLDTTIADPSVRVDGKSGTLSLDVSGPTMEGEQIDSADVRFVGLVSTGTTGNSSRRQVQADSALTADGAVAFPNYEAGTSFDPVLITFEVPEDCATPVDDVDVSSSGYSTSFIPLILMAGGAIVLLAVLAAIVVARRRRA